MQEKKNSSIEVFSTCPQSKNYTSEEYLQSVKEVSEWSEKAGCKGILVYTDNGLVDPWMIAQTIIKSTDHLSPLVAVQPVYMHPYTVAKMVSTLGYLYNRRIYLNMVAGGFKNDLEALNDPTPHDKRYERLIEYTTIIKELLKGESPVTYEGEFYSVYDLSLKPKLPEELIPGIFISGSSEAGRNAATQLKSTAIKYPQPPGDYKIGEELSALRTGIRVGIIAREQSETAWEVGLKRFPPDRKGQLAHKLAMKTSDSEWHKKLSKMADELEDKETPYWLHPFENYKTFCPYLVGSYEQVTDEISRYIKVGFETFILDIPPSREELEHTGLVFEKAKEAVRV